MNGGYFVIILLNGVPRPVDPFWIWRCWHIGPAVNRHPCVASPHAARQMNSTRS